MSPISSSALVYLFRAKRQIYAGAATNSVKLEHAKLRYPSFNNNLMSVMIKIECAALALKQTII